MAKLFSKEKDIVLKVINSILVIWLIAAIVITFGVGIRIFNKDVTLSYSDYSKQICDLDKIPTEEIDKQLKIIVMQVILPKRKKMNHIIRQMLIIFLYHYQILL